MMINIIEFISHFFGFGEVRDESETAENSLPGPNREYEWFWPRLFFLSSSNDKCEEEEKPNSTEICFQIKHSRAEKNCGEEHEQEEEEEEEEEQEQEQEEEQEEEYEGEDEEIELCLCPETGGLRQELGCIYRNAKFGLREGALSGMFLGGAFGIYKYIDAVYIKGESSEGGDGTENTSDSTLNDNIIFVTAINSAIVMGVFCTILCCSRGIMYC